MVTREINKNTVQSDEDREHVSRLIEHFWQQVAYRVNYHMQWEEIAALIWPECRGTFEVGSYNWPGMKMTQSQIDCVGMIALDRFTGIMQHLLTPSDIQWHNLTTVDPYLAKQPRVAAWMERVTRLLFAYRYAQTANFAGQCVAAYKNLGAFGSLALFIDELYDPVYHRRGLRYRAIPAGELFFYENHQGQVAGVYRYFRMTAHQCIKQFGPENFPPGLLPALEDHSQWQFEFIHHVGLRDKWKPGSLGDRGKPYRSDWISLTSGGWLLQTGGYPVFPYAISRYSQAPREVYGRGPAMSVLPSLKTLNAEKRMFLKVGQRTADPVLLVQDDSMLNDFDMEPGAINTGGVDGQGHLLVNVLPSGNLQITETMMAAEAQIVKDAFLTTLFDILVQDRVQQTATEVLMRAQEEGALLSPMVSRQAEFEGPLIDRELSILHDFRVLPPIPPELKEAGGEYQVEYTSPLNSYMRSGNASGFLRTVESMMPVAQATGDPSIFHIFDFKRAYTDVADIQGVPASYMATPDEIKQKEQAAQQAQQQRAQIEAAPAQSAMMKAQAAMAKVQMMAGQSGSAPQAGGMSPDQSQGQQQMPAQYGPPPGAIQPGQ